MKRLTSVLFWSVIAAAFIGPGTVTVAATAGAAHGYQLLWALLFSTVATLVLQEASARVTVVSGRNLGQAIRERYRGGAFGVWVVLLVLGAIVLGNAAYEAGNILGAVAGVTLVSSASPAALTLGIGVVAGAVLWLGSPRVVAHLLSLVVAFMGVVFVAAAVGLAPPLDALLRGSVVPAAPTGGGLLVLGLVGTTVVPYNLFLGSGIAAGQTLRELRFGLAVAVLLGGLISMAVLVVGAAVQGPFSFEALAAALTQRHGEWAGAMFAGGLFAAGASSAITAPLAAAITARSLLAGDDDAPARWHSRGWRYRAVWLGVLAVGIGFGLAEVRPVPAIILAQALNGVVLPFAALFLLLVVNDRALLGDGVNGPVANLATVIVVAVTVVLGTSGVLRAGASAAGLVPPGENLLLGVSAVVLVLLSVPIARGIRRARNAVPTPEG